METGGIGNNHNKGMPNFILHITPSLQHTGNNQYHLKHKERNRECMIKIKNKIKGERREEDWGGDCIIFGVKSLYNNQYFHRNLNGLN